jgi:hypothetical protein
MDEVEPEMSDHLLSAGAWSRLRRGGRRAARRGKIAGGGAGRRLVEDLAGASRTLGRQWTGALIIFSPLGFVCV